MASSSAPLFSNNRRSLDSAEDADEETALLGGLATTSSTRPFATTLYPTIFTRSLSLLFLIPSFILFTIHGPRFAPTICFLSFAIARQIVVLGSHFGSQIVIIHIEVVHERLKSVSAKAQERWIKRSAGLVVDGVILVGMLVTLGLDARKLDSCLFSCSWRPTVMGGVILGFLSFGLLLCSVPDCGSPSQVTLAVAVERPLSGVVKLATNVYFGELEDLEEGGSWRKPGTFVAGQHDESLV